jgi:hypothetical protein
MEALVHAIVSSERRRRVVKKESVVVFQKMRNNRRVKRGKRHPRLTTASRTSPARVWQRR